MSTPGVPTTTEQAGRRLGVWSVVMVPTAFVSIVVANLVGYGLMQAMGMADNETFYDKGFRGWLVILLLLVIMCVPQVVGLVLGVRARRLGARTLGTVGLVLNALILGYWVAVMVVNVAAA